jgi:mono/diheme cytochrome c family protein
MSRTRNVVALLIGILLLAGCNGLVEQPKIETYGLSPTFGQAARTFDPNAVAVGFRGDDELHYYGTVDGEPVDLYPFEVTSAMLERGQEQYKAFCMPCHGYTGYGEGVITQKGFAPKPASFHDPSIAEQPVSYYVQVMYEGKGAMFSYASRVQPDDRWAIAAYIRALQLSQNVQYDAVSAEVQQTLSEQQ